MLRSIDLSIVRLIFCTSGNSCDYIWLVALLGRQCLGFVQSEIEQQTKEIILEFHWRCLFCVYYRVGYNSTTSLFNSTCFDLCIMAICWHQMNWEYSTSINKHRFILQLRPTFSHRPHDFRLRGQIEKYVSENINITLTEAITRKKNCRKWVSKTLR